MPPLASWSVERQREGGRHPQETAMPKYSNTRMYARAMRCTRGYRVMAQLTKEANLRVTGQPTRATYPPYSPTHAHTCTHAQLLCCESAQLLPFFFSHVASGGVTSMCVRACTCPPLSWLHLWHLAKHPPSRHPPSRALLGSSLLAHLSYSAHRSVAHLFRCWWRRPSA